MPTHNDETLHDRYAREHADHMARLAKMTPEQIAEMELSLHNAMAEVDRLRANACQGGEAVEVVAYHGKKPDGGEGFVGARWPNAFGEDCIVEPLMTVAQHQRILAAATHPADQVAECERLRDLLADWASHFTGPKVIGGPLSSLRERTEEALLNGGRS